MCWEEEMFGLDLYLIGLDSGNHNEVKQSGM